MKEFLSQDTHGLPAGVQSLAKFRVGNIYKRENHQELVTDHGKTSQASPVSFPSLVRTLEHSQERAAITGFLGFRHPCDQCVYWCG